MAQGWVTSAGDAVFKVSLVIRLRPRSAVTGKEDTVVKLTPFSKMTGPAMLAVQWLQIQQR